MDDTVAHLEDGLDTRIAATGWPLAISETMQLKLASAMLARPKVLVLGELFDTMPVTNLQHSIERLRNEYGTTVIYFSNRHPGDSIKFDLYLHLGIEKQTTHSCYEELEATLNKSTEKSLLITANQAPRCLI